MEEKMIVGPAYRIETSRLVLRCWNPLDAFLLKEAIDTSIDHLSPWMPWANDEPEPAEAKIQRLRKWRALFDLGQDFVFGIFNQAEDRVMGGTGLHTRVMGNAREIGYWIRADEINRGYATEAAAALVKVAFEIDLVDRVEVHCEPANVRSYSVPKKLGFTHDATLRKRTPIGGKLIDRMVWSILKEEYPDSPCAKQKIKAYDVAGRLILS